MASGLAEISLDKTATIRPDKNEPVVVKNLQYWFSTSNDGFVLAYSTHHFNGADGNPKYSYEKRNGFTIAWTRKARSRRRRRPRSRRPSDLDVEGGRATARFSLVGPCTIVTEEP